MRHEKRIESFLFDQFFENLLGHLVIRHARIDLDPEFGAAFTAFFARVIEPFRIDLANKIAITRTSPRPSQVDRARHISFRISMLDSEGRASARPTSDPVCLAFRRRRSLRRLFSALFARVSARWQIISSTRSAIFSKSA